MLGVDEERALLTDLPVPPADRWLQLLYQCVSVPSVCHPPVWRAELYLVLHLWRLACCAGD